jgi:putative chitobiose transport system permease protein
MFILPALIFLLLFIFLPTVQIFYYSTLHYNVFQPSTFAGWANVSRLLSDSDFWWTFANSLLFMLVTPVMMVVSLSLALMVRQLRRGQKLFRTMFFLPVVTPVVIAGIIWRWIFAEDTGVLNYLLSLVGIQPIHWLTEYPTNIVSVMLVTLWRGAGYYMVIFLAGLAVLPCEVEEASLLDGAGPVRQAVYILIPLLRPTITFVFVISATAAIKLFTEIYILIPGQATANKTLVTYLYSQAFEQFDIGYGSTIAVVVFALTLTFSFMQIRLMERQDVA